MAKLDLGSKGFVKVTDVATAGDKEYNPKDISVKVLSEKFVSIPESIGMLKIAYPKYARRLVLTGKLKAIKVAIRGGSKWFIDKGSIRTYIDTTSRSRELRNYILRIPLEREDDVRSALKKLGISYELELAYVAKE